MNITSNVYLITKPIMLQICYRCMEISCVVHSYVHGLNYDSRSWILDAFMVVNNNGLQWHPYKEWPSKPYCYCYFSFTLEHLFKRIVSVITILDNSAIAIMHSFIWLYRTVREDKNDTATSIFQFYDWCTKYCTCA